MNKVILTPEAQSDLDKIANSPYHGITYNAPWTNDTATTHEEEMRVKEEQEIWKRDKCSVGVHCLDEVYSPQTEEENKLGFGPEHYLHCDACGLIVHIAKIETNEQVKERLDKIDKS